MPLTTATNVRVPLGFSGGFTYNNQPLKLNGDVQNFDALMRAQPTQMRLEVASNVINAKFQGTLSKDGAISGPISLGAHSVRSLRGLAWSPNAARKRLRPRCSRRTILGG